MPVLRFSALFRQSFITFRAKWLSFLALWAIIIIVYAPLIALIVYYDIKANQAVGAEFEMGSEDIADYRQWKEESESPFSEETEPPPSVMMAIVGEGRSFNELDNAIAAEQAKMVMPGGIIYIVTLFVNFIFMIAMWLLALPHPPALGQAIVGGARLLPKMLGIFALLFLASGIWLPLASFFIPGGEKPALVLLFLVTAWIMYAGPRVMTIIPLLLTKNPPVMEVVRKGYAASKGYWGKIVGNTLLLSLVFMGVYLAFVAIIMGVGVAVYMTTESLAVMFTGVGIALLLYMAFLFVVSMVSAIFYIRLGLTILENPRP